MIIEGECSHVLRMLLLSNTLVDLCYADPPFNTGRVQKIHGQQYEDTNSDYIHWLMNRMKLIRDLLKPTGSILLHLDKNEVHYAKVAMDQLFGRDNFRNEIIWAYDYGGRSKTTWPAKHDTLLFYSKSNQWTFNQEGSDRLPYDSPGLVGADKVARGKFPTDVHWHTICPTNGSERLNYPTQKPIGLLRRWVGVHSNIGDTILEPFGGTGTASAAAQELGREFIAVDKNAEAIAIMEKRLHKSRIYLGGMN